MKHITRKKSAALIALALSLALCGGLLAGCSSDDDADPTQAVSSAAEESEEPSAAVEESEAPEASEDPSLAEDGDDYVLTLTQSCTTDAETYVNMTNHAYFNLAGHASGSVHDQVVSIDADLFLPVREDSVSEGEILPVAGTPFDFTEPKPLGRDIAENDEQLDRARGYDHCFCVRGYGEGDGPRHALRATDPASGRTLDILITTPGAHLYTGNWLDDAIGVKDGATYVPRSGFAFEPEFYPDCVHHEDWPQSVCAPGKPYASTIVYRLSVS